MAVTSVTIWRSNPGRRAAHMVLTAKAKAIHERLGGKVRVQTVVVGGASGQQIVYSVEFADMAAYAAWSAKAGADAEHVAFWTEAFAEPNPVATFVSNALLTDVPGL